RIDQFLPAFPIADADLRNEKEIVRNLLLPPERARVPSLRIEERDIGSRVNNGDLVIGKPAAGDDHILDLLADRDDAIDALRPVLAAIPDIERKRHAAIDDERSDRIARR